MDKLKRVVIRRKFKFVEYISGISVILLKPKTCWLGTRMLMNFVGRPGAVSSVNLQCQ